MINLIKKIFKNPAIQNFKNSHYDFIDTEYSFEIKPNPEKLSAKNIIERKLFDLHIKKYKIRGDLSVDVFEDVDFYQNSFTSLPIKFNQIDGNFICDQLRLNTFENFPKYIKGNCSIKNNPIYEWINCPEQIGGNFFIQGSLLKDLKCFKTHINGLFHLNSHIVYFPENMTNDIIFVINKSFDLLKIHHPNIEKFITYRNNLLTINTYQLKNYHLYLQMNHDIEKNFYHQKKVIKL